ncbi:hypothetical protein G6F24_015989 [Rhizopus arrhizus]|nr:hypothetical protein G6F24_015989 [Rhizopus arrhizus]
MRDEEHGKMQLLLELAQHSQHLVLHRDVQRRHRFIRHDQFRRHGDGAGKAQALALAARKFVGITIQRGRVQLDQLHQFARPAHGRAGRHAMPAHASGQDARHGMAGV